MPEAIALPSTWRGPELKVITGRVLKTRAQLASLRDSTPPVDSWLEAAALADEAFPLRDADGSTPPRCSGCSRCEKRTRATRRERMVRA